MSGEEQIRGLFGFDESDLLANIKGQFSDKQKQKLTDIDQSVSKFILILAVLALAGAIWRTVVFFNAQEGGGWILPIILLAVSIWLFSGVFTKVDTTINKAEGVVNFVKVESKTGSVTDLQINRRTVYSYEMRVGGVAFSNANPALIERMQGDIYAVYYTSSTRQILSAQFITKGE